MLILFVGLVAAPPALSATQSAAPADTSALQFHGFRAGARLDEIQALLRRPGGGRLRCDHAKADRRVAECRGTLQDAELGGRVSLWISAIDSVAGVTTISSVVAPRQLDQWRREIEARYGRVKPRVQGAQSMMQWVRRGRMLRLTWRTERGARTASVSLVDGRVLDQWGRARAHPLRRTRKLPSDSSRK
ncbi:MAG: hypothetical protein H0T44_11400 [Gemmatimonadales bacterium]|nr:hypothetical protein [Gemmatimonadales bacterium]